jgi:hypothetical protein
MKRKRNKSKKIDTIEFMTPSFVDPGDLLIMCVQAPAAGDTREFVSRMVGNEVHFFAVEQDIESDSPSGIFEILAESSAIPSPVVEQVTIS